MANILGALHMILLGPWLGFFSAGLDSFLCDLTSPYFGMEAPITLLTKGMYGMVAGLVQYFVFVRLFRRKSEFYATQLVSTIAADAVYLVLYGVKNFFCNRMLILGYASAGQCWALVVTQLSASIVSGVLAVIFTPILGTVLLKALKSACLNRMLYQSVGKKQ